MKTSMKTNKGMITEDVDVMTDNCTSHYCTMRYEHSALFVFDALDRINIINMVLEKHPTLKFRDIQILVRGEVLRVDHGEIIPDPTFVS